MRTRYQGYLFRGIPSRSKWECCFVLEPTPTTSRRIKFERAWTYHGAGCRGTIPIRHLVDSWCFTKVNLPSIDERNNLYWYCLRNGSNWSSPYSHRLYTHFSNMKVPTHQQLGFIYCQKMISFEQSQSGRFELRLWYADYDRPQLDLGLTFLSQSAVFIDYQNDNIGFCEPLWHTHFVDTIRVVLFHRVYKLSWWKRVIDT